MALLVEPGVSRVDLTAASVAVVMGKDGTAVQHLVAEEQPFGLLCVVIQPVLVDNLLGNSATVPPVML
jgi:hypothetical protein